MKSLQFSFREVGEHSKLLHVYSRVSNKELSFDKSAVLLELSKFYIKYYLLSHKLQALQSSKNENYIHLRDLKYV
jgi:hypothetical protein